MEQTIGQVLIKKKQLMARMAAQPEIALSQALFTTIWITIIRFYPKKDSLDKNSCIWIDFLSCSQAGTISYPDNFIRLALRSDT